MRRLQSALLASVVMLLLAGCGVPTDEAPRVISAGNVPFGLLDAAPPTTSSTVLPSDASALANVYLLGPSDRLTPVQTLVPSPPTAAAAIDALLAGPSDGQRAGGFLTFIPGGTRLLSAPIDAGVATVDLSSEFASNSTFEQILAVAQIVYTVTQFEGITAVRFAVDGVSKDVPTQNGTLTQGQPVTRDDYAIVAQP